MYVVSWTHVKILTHVIVRKPMTESDVKALLPKEKKYVISAGNGLEVIVNPNGSKYFRWAYLFPPSRKGKRCSIHIGTYCNESGVVMPLKAAREEKNRLDVLRKQGKNPAVEKSKDKAEVTGVGSQTFEEIAWEWFGEYSTKKRPSTAADVKLKLKNQILPAFGKYPIKQISRPECIRFLQSHVKRGKPEQGRKLLGVMRQVFAYAIDIYSLYSSNDENPARSSENTQTGHRAKSRPSLTDWKDVPAFLVAVSENKCKGEFQTNIAVKLAAFCFLRASSLVSSKWSDINWNEKMLTTPAEFMKGKREHLTPLSSSALELFRKLQAINGDEEWVFFSPRGKKYPHINPSSPNHHIKNLGYEGKMTTHGFRAMAMTHGREQLGYSQEIIRLQLAHFDRDKIIGAYDRSSFIKERTKFMNEWSDLLLENGLEV